MNISNLMNPGLPYPVEGFQFEKISPAKRQIVYLTIFHTNTFWTFDSFKCPYKDCIGSYTNKKNLEIHIKRKHTNPIVRIEFPNT